MNTSPPIKLSLSALARELGVECENCQAAAPAIDALATHSAQAKPGSLFVAIIGEHFDGHEKIDQAFANGSLACVVSKPECLKGRPGLIVSDTRKALSKISAILYGHPARELTLIGVTGTNGKTTTTCLIYNLLWALQRPCLRVGTLGVEVGSLLKLEENFTTPEANNLQRYFRQACELGVRHVVMETSSHALEQERLSDVAFDLGIFSNLTRDHLDYHASMQAYLSAKLRLLDLLAAKPSGLKTMIVNCDSEYGAAFVERAHELNLKTFSYGFSAGSDFLIGDFSQTFQGANFTLQYQGKNYRIKTALIGRHNCFNIASALCALHVLGFDLQRCVELLSTLPQVPGRLESVPGPDFGVYVDYAHTPDALENVLLALRPLAQNKLWVVFGCGGDRDKGKRPIMAEVAARHADHVVVTSDNPRTEKPEAIAADILASGVKPYAVQLDRRAAIELAVSKAQAGDVVLIAGKGHEDYQVIGHEKIHLSDVEEVKNSLKKKYA